LRLFSPSEHIEKLWESYKDVVSSKEKNFGRNIHVALGRGIDVHHVIVVLKVALRMALNA
jgi:hypothetical protein